MTNSFESLSHLKCEFGVLLMGGRALTEGFHLDITARYTVAETLTVTRTSPGKHFRYTARWGEPPFRHSEKDAKVPREDIREGQKEPGQLLSCSHRHRVCGKDCGQRHGDGRGDPWCRGLLPAPHKPAGLPELKHPTSQDF